MRVSRKFLKHAASSEQVRGPFSAEASFPMPRSSFFLRSTRKALCGGTPRLALPCGSMVCRSQAPNLKLHFEQLHGHDARAFRILHRMA